MTKKRFKIINTDKFSYKFKIVVDTHTGVNYLFAQKEFGGGITPLLDSNGEVVVTPVDRD